MTIDQNKVQTFRYSFHPFLSPIGHGLIRGHHPLGSSRKGRDCAYLIDAMSSVDAKSLSNIHIYLDDKSSADVKS